LHFSFRDGPTLGGLKIYFGKINESAAEHKKYFAIRKFCEPREFAVSAGRGAKTIFFKVKEDAGESPAVSDSITLK
jgi:hypothetical protein